MWRLRRLALLVVFSGSASPIFSHASELAFSRNARTFEAHQSGLMEKGMAHACLSVTLIADSLPCNPALTPFTRKPTLSAQLMISNGYATLERMLELKRGEVSQELVDGLFSRDQVMQIEASGELAFRSEYLNAKYVPANAKFFAVTRNEANPDVDLFAVIEDNYTVQSGAELIDKLLYAGMQIRFVKRQYVRRRFKLLELTTESGKTLLRFSKQQAVYFEPAMTLALPMIVPTRLSVMLANGGIYSGDSTGLPIPVQLEGAIGVTVPVPIGELELDLDYRGLSYDEEPLDRFHWGAIYRFGSMNLMGGLDVFGASGGIFYEVERVNAGIIYSTTRVPWNSDEFYTQTVYLEVGWQI